ncbi:hypothetical protein EDD66_11239 [Mobilisporobacter senegalensis]|uniref:DUF2271 domain-containing protein n=1 Tax=Mobilisporobacter senegalensis TaxID=1329262 RepID=A0A3N1XCZ5_9FIRM|nr:DUF2271 domain-containing protein [Mobilisporobacter senegalensis]ROR23908.1 hypothetical protein EDD66_11239 [Mobilisporobacter senegalensis]
MKKRIIPIGIMVLIICAIIFFVILTRKDKVINLKDNMTGKSVSISIYKGKNYLHDFKVNSFITIKTPPQMAVWVEDLQGNYIETLYATSKIVHQNWSKASSDHVGKGQIQRKEALPYWTHKRSNVQIVPDTITSATPKGNATIHTKLDTEKNQYIILAEINMSTDFNDYYPREAKIGDVSYSGGEYGSGQPGIVYSATIDSTDQKTYELVQIGHSSPDGSDGKLNQDFTKLTTAKDIIDKITFTIK